MQTQALYLEDTYCYEADAKVIEISQDERGTYIILDQTVFYPQGGGQPSDTGTMVSKDGKAVIYTVRSVEDEIRHYVNENSLQIGDEVRAQIDSDLRLKNAKLHTAGHLIADIVDNMGLGLKAVKGHHFHEGSYVEFEGEVEDKEGLIVKANEALTKAIDDNIETNAEKISGEEFKTKCSHITYDIPANKDLRVFTIGNYLPVPCGGTHVKNLGEINSITISKIKCKNKRTKVSYFVT